MTPPNDNFSPFIRTGRKDGETPTSRAEPPAGEAPAPTLALPQVRAQRVTESNPDNAPDTHTSMISRDLTILGRNVRKLPSQSGPSPKPISECPELPLDPGSNEGPRGGIGSVVSGGLPDKCGRHPSERYPQGA